MQCAHLGGEHFAILSTFIKLPFIIKIFVSSIFEWPFYTGFTVYNNFQFNALFILQRFQTSQGLLVGLLTYNITIKQYDNMYDDADISDGQTYRQNRQTDGQTDTQTSRQNKTEKGRERT